MYETTPKWHGFSITQLAALAAGQNSEPQNIECRVSKDGNASGYDPTGRKIFFKTDRIHSFDVRRSSVSFSIKQAVFWPVAGLTPDTLFSNPVYNECLSFANSRDLHPNCCLYTNIPAASPGSIAITWIIFFLPDVMITTSTGDSFGALLYPTQMAAACWVESFLAARGSRAMGLG